jgi:hypothetical protein
MGHAESAGFQKKVMEDAVDQRNALSAGNHPGCIRWYVAYPLSYRHLEEMMQERGVIVDHSTINRWAVRFFAVLEKVFRKNKCAVGSS